MTYNFSCNCRYLEGSPQATAGLAVWVVLAKSSRHHFASNFPGNETTITQISPRSVARLTATVDSNSTGQLRDPDQRQRGTSLKIWESLVKTIDSGAMRSLSCCLLWLVGGVRLNSAAEVPTFLLAAELAAGDTTTVKVTLEVGGEMLVNEETGTKKLPLTVAGELQYTEQLLAWSADPAHVARSLREYQTATAKIQVDDGGILRSLPDSQRLVVAEIRDGRAALGGNGSSLTRDQFDLINVIGNSLALNRLLPERELADGESWEHESASIGALLGMDHVAACAVRSVVAGNTHRQVQIRLAGTVHGTIDGAPTEVQLRGAYLFHQQRKQITKFNLAIKELRTASEIVPGLDVVAKISVSVSPANESLAGKFNESARDVSHALAESLRYDAPQQGYRFLHDRRWYVTAEQSDLVSLRCLQDGSLTAHCNVTTLPARSEGRGSSLQDFERDVRQTLGDNLETVTASTEWTTAEGHECLGVVAQGQIKGVAIEWRYYLVASPDLPRISVAVTMKQSMVEQFNDADRQLVDSLELREKPATGTAAKPSLGELLPRK